MLIKDQRIKTAIVHDWFCNMGGGDKVAEAFLDILPDSPVYVSCYLEKSLTPGLKKADIRTSFLQKYLKQKKDNHQSLLPFMPAAFESFDMNKYDLVLSSSSCCAKGIVTNPDTIHICYCHTPMRYAWEFFYEYTEHMRPFKKKIIGLAMSYIRLWDAVSAGRVDYFIANSGNVAKRIKKHYGRDAQVIHPPIDTEYFRPGDKDGDFYLCVSRLVKYKRIDLAVEACNRLKLKLVVIGQGAEYENLKKAAGPTVRILGRQEDHVIREYYQQCRAFIFPGEEDFGMTPLEAQACGRPVIAYKKGGALETVVEDVTGVFFEEQTSDSLAGAIGLLEEKCFDREAIRAHAQNYGTERFRWKMLEFIERCYVEKKGL